MKGVLPTIWKEGKIIPLPNDGRQALSGKNSRPITILPVLIKLIERIVHSQMQEYFDCNGLNTDFQNAYRHNHSTCSALTVMTDDWLKDIDNLKMTGAVLLDFNAAFYVIDHNLLISKLECYGFSPTAIQFIKRYLTSRTQQVYYTGSWSHSKVWTAGSRKGAALDHSYTPSSQMIYHQYCVKQLYKCMLMIPHCIMLQRVNWTLFYHLS